MRKRIPFATSGRPSAITTNPTKPRNVFVFHPDATLNDFIRGFNLTEHDFFVFDNKQLNRYIQRSLNRSLNCLDKDNKAYVVTAEERADEWEDRIAYASKAFDQAKHLQTKTAPEEEAVCLVA
jgi:hypothetical protein